MIKVNRYTLENGLQLVHCEDRSTQMVALNVLYKVGSRDENPDHTGFAHLFEHLMFGGSVNIPNFDEPLELAGGENNAWTNSDITNYYISVPRQNIETAFWLESDRMLSLDFNPRSLEVQRQVVMEEFKQRSLNQPYGDISHLMRRLAYKKHPYRWPTIGKKLSHIAKATLWEVQGFFERFYTPSNAIVVVTGNISFETAKQRTVKWFGSIEGRQVLPKAFVSEPQQRSERRLTIERNVPADALYMAFHMCGRMHPDYYAFDIVSDVLANGRSSRFTQHLVNDRKLFSNLDAYISGEVDPGLFHISGKMAQGVSLEEGEAAIWEELRVLKEDLVLEKELQKLKNQFEATQTFNNMNYLNLAQNLAFFELMGDAELINKEVARYQAITSQQLQSIVRRAFDHSNCCVIHYKAKRES